MIDITEIQAEYKQDVEWTPETVPIYMNRIPILIAKYQDHWFRYKNQYDKLQRDYDNSYFSKYSYYKAGESDFVLSSTEIKQFVEKDTSVTKIHLDMRKALANCELIEKMMKNLDSIRWDIKNWLEYQKFINGVL
jgi:hypothetical protein